MIEVGGEVQLKTSFLTVGLVFPSNDCGKICNVIVMLFAIFFISTWDHTQQVKRNASLTGQL